MDDSNQNQETTKVGTAASVESVQTSSEQGNFSRRKRKFSLFLPLIIFAVFLLVGGAAAYILVQKTPEEKFASALANTSNAIEKVITMERNTSAVDIDGGFSVTSPIVADGSINGRWQESSGSLEGQLNALGAQVDAEVRAIVPEGALAPDVYINVSGLTSVAGLLGIVGADAPSGVDSFLSSLDGEWYVVNHTLIESPVSADDTTQLELTEEEIDDITRQALVPIRERLLSANPETAVFRINEVYGDEQFEGDDTVKMNVGINKDNFIAFVSDYQAVIENTKLKELLQSTSPGSSIDELLAFDEFEERLNEIDSVDFENGSADVWVESNGRFIRNIRLYPDEDNRESNYLDFSLPYEGGDVYPLEMKVRMDEDGSAGALMFGFNFNQVNGNSELLFDVNLEGDSGLVAASGNLVITGTDEPVEVSAPEGATNILEVLQGALNPLQSQLESQLPAGFDSSDFESVDDVEIQIENLNL